MSHPSKLDLLPEPIRMELNRRLIAKAFSDFEGLATWLGEQGCEIKKSAVHAYGQRLKRMVERQQRTTRAAEALMAEAPDDQAARSAAIIATAETDLFEVLADLQEAEDVSPEERLKLLSRAGRTAADLGRAVISVNRYRHEVETRAKSAADKAEKIAKKGGLTEEAVTEIRKQILGIAA